MSASMALVDAGSVTPRKAAASHTQLTAVSSPAVHSPATQYMRNRRKGTIEDLEKCLQSSFASENAPLLLENEDFKEVLGRISFAVYVERTIGMTQSEQSEEAFSKVSLALAKALDKDEVKTNKELSYWLRLFDKHVNSHLHQIVLSADKKKPTAAELLEEENRKLKQEMNRLKTIVDDLKAELEVFQSPQNSSLTQHFFSTSRNTRLHSPNPLSSSSLFLSSPIASSNNNNNDESLYIGITPKRLFSDNNGNSNNPNEDSVRLYAGENSRYIELKDAQFNSNTGNNNSNSNGNNNGDNSNSVTNNTSTPGHTTNSATNTTNTIDNSFDFRSIGQQYYAQFGNVDEEDEEEGVSDEVALEVLKRLTKAKSVVVDLKHNNEQTRSILLSRVKNNGYSSSALLPPTSPPSPTHIPSYSK